MLNDDLTLLREYSRSHSEPAFATLVSRHVNLVYSVAMRRVRDSHLAEEITQAVFIILARKADKLDGKTILSAWLCRTAHYVSARALRTEFRRQRREQEAYMQFLLNESESEIWTKIAPMLDDALDRLGHKDHDAIVLRFFENKSLGEVGLAIGAGEDTARMRVNRALEKLQKFFTKRGIDSTTATIAETISANSVQAAPVALAKTVTAVALIKGATASISTLTLIKGALKIMMWTKAKTAVIVGVAALLTVGTATVAVKVLSAPPITLNEAYVKLYSASDSGGRVLDIRPLTVPTNEVALCGDVENFDHVPSDDREIADFNDQTVSASYLLPKGWTAVLFENANFDGTQYQLVGTGKRETIPDFSHTQPAFDRRASSLRWVQTKGAPVTIPQWKGLSGPSASNYIQQFSQTPAGTLALDAIKFLQSVKLKGQLPGIVSNTPAAIEIPWFSHDLKTDTWHSSNTNLESYPFSLTLTVHANDPNERFHYTIEKASQTNDWQLQKAWRTDTNGGVAEEFSVP